MTSRRDALGAAVDFRRDALLPLLFTRFPKTANRRAPLFLDCSYRGDSLHNAYRPNTGEMERKEVERKREKERESRSDGRDIKVRRAVQERNLNFRTDSPQSGNFFNVYSF